MTAHITDIGTTPALFLVAILLMMMGLGVYLFFSMSETRTVMYITNAGLLALCAMFGWFLYGVYHSTVTIEGDMLRVNVYRSTRQSPTNRAWFTCRRPRTMLCC